ncbi:hypothetical protein CEXT_141871 [Caerostris extrusa]|uniref:Uncharacterized protein n=1 Tax=Caerostris extrusa TaxID=172846 RepID=A0AAV4QRB0_CAEEX|nr:hypothetical protein CEXT_141871 [Caerostris extrusa]
MGGVGTSSRGITPGSFRMTSKAALSSGDVRFAYEFFNFETRSPRQSLPNRKHEVVRTFDSGRVERKPPGIPDTCSLIQISREGSIQLSGKKKGNSPSGFCRRFTPARSEPTFSK